MCGITVRIRNRKTVTLLVVMIKTLTVKLAANVRRKRY